MVFAELLSIASIMAFGYMLMKYAWLISLFYGALFGLIIFVVLKSVRDSISKNIPLEFFGIGGVFAFYFGYLLVFSLLSDPIIVIIIAIAGPVVLLPITMAMISFLK